MFDALKRWERAILIAKLSSAKVQFTEVGVDTYDQANSMEEARYEMFELIDMLSRRSN